MKMLNTFYKCNPEMNKKCNKSGCVHNKKSVYPVCDLTKNKEYSTDGLIYSVSDKKNYSVNFMSGATLDEVNRLFGE